MCVFLLLCEGAAAALVEAAGNHLLTRSLIHLEVKGHVYMLTVEVKLPAAARGSSEALRSGLRVLRLL